MYLRDAPPEIRELASQAFNRSWHFIEHDPVLAGMDRASMQDELAQHIERLLRDGERNVLIIANRAIGVLRQQHVSSPELV